MVREDAGEAITWRWSFFFLGVLYALPAVVATPFAPGLGLAFAVGVLPVAAFNLPGVRRGRRIIPFVGALSGVALVGGSILTQVPWVAVVGIFALAVGSSWWGRRSRIGALVLVLCVPLVGIGLSIPSVPVALVLGMCIVGGSVYAYAVAMLWPEHQVAAPAPPPAPDRRDTLIYGVLLGLAGAVSAAVGYIIGLEHVGWAVGSALLVMRPVQQQLVRRSIGRAISVLAGAAAAAGFAVVEPSAAIIGCTVGFVIACLSATQASRWYVAPGFTTFIVLTMLIALTDSRPAVSFVERIVATGIGVGAALFFGAVIPALIRGIRRRQSSPPLSITLTSPPDDVRTQPESWNTP